MYKNQPDDLNYRLASKVGSNIQLVTSELNEMRSFVQKKTNKQWIWIADWTAYKGVFSKERHQSSKQKKDTNDLERLNNTIKQRVSRLVRKLRSFAKILENHIGAIKYFFCHYNLEQQEKWDKYESAHL